ncbi:MAG TPA: carboxypeptidase regulatory-like domain-containing protein [Anaerolineae bacterium]|nr:carboxypeptidase regulatory-like domain-containing protein [Anaerolineae bacterium]
MFTTATTCRTSRRVATLARCLLVAVVLLTSLGAARLGTPPASAQEPPLATRLDGWLTIVWGDALDGSDPSGPLYFLTTAREVLVQLLIEPTAELPAGGILRLNRQHVVVSGTWVDDAALPYPTLRVSSIQATSVIDDTVDDIVGPQPWVSLLCKFADVPAEPQPLSYFQGMYGSELPGLDHYWREQSYDIANVLGSGAFGWYTLPQPWSYYVYDRDGDGQPDLDWTRAANDCTAVADPDVYFPDYVGINLMFNANLDCCAWGGSMWLNLDGVWRNWRMTWEPPWGWGNVTVIAHEMGHGFGLPHSSGMYGNVYDNHWDVMSDAWANCGEATHPVYGCMGQHTISPYKNQLGWFSPEEQYQAAVGSQATIFLERTALPQGTNFKIASIPLLTMPGSVYTLETRHQVGYDTKLNGDAVIIHRVDSGYAYVLDPDWNGNTGDEGAMWRVGETIADSANETTVTIDAANALGFTVTIRYGAGYDISGYVRDEAGDGIEGVSVAFGGVRPSVATDASGYYTQSNFGNGTYTVTLSRAGYTFSPVKHEVVVSDANALHDATGYPLLPVALPFADGFESGDLGSGWAIETDYAGRVRVGTAYPHTGSYSLLLDDSSDPLFFSHAAAVLTLDLSAYKEVELSFWWREFNDENHVDDGVFISDDDGATWVRVVSFNNGPFSFTQSIVDLDAAAAAAGMTLNDHFLVKFQYFDDDPIPSDGYAIDDVLVTGILALVPPSDLAATPVSPARVALTWLDNSPDESSFHVERSPSGAAAWTEVATVTENVTTYVDVALACATAYDYRVRGHRTATGTYSDYSHIATATTLSVPAVPTLTFPVSGTTACDTGLHFAWDAVDGATSYQVELTANPSFTSPVFTATTSAPAFTSTAAIPAGTYYWRVLAANACGAGAWSAAHLLDIVNAPVLSSPLDGSAVVGTPTFSWYGASGALSYRLLVDDDPDWSSPVVDTIVSATSHTPAAPLSSGTYYWQVKTTNEWADLAPSAIWTFAVSSYRLYLPVVQRGEE